VWFCETQAARLSHLPPQHVLSGGCLEAYDEKVLREMAAVYADSTAMRVRVVAPEFKSLQDLKTEKWYGTNYIMEKFSPELIQRLNQPKEIAEFHLPEVNPFVAEDFSLKFPPLKASEKSEAGCQNGTPKYTRCECGIKKAPEAAAGGSNNSVVKAPAPAAPAAELYFLPDRAFELPKVDLSLQISNGLAATSAKNTAIAHLWSDLVDDALSDLNHLAEQSGLGSFSWPSPQGLCLRFTGYNHRIRAFIRTLLPKLREVRAVERVEQFERLKEAMLRKLTAWQKETALAHAREDANALRLETHWTVGEQLASFTGIRPEDVDRFVAEWFTTGRIFCLALGNIEEDQARQIVNDVQEVFQLTAVLPAEEHINRCIQLPTSHTCIRRMPAPNSEDSNSACFNVYQIGEADEATDAVQCLVSHILSDALFDQLRTKETLGYLVSGYHRKSAGILHYHIAVQSSDAAADYLNARIEAFLSWFRSTKLAELVAETPDFLEKNKAAVMSLLTEKDKSLGDEQSRFWPEIERRRFDWLRRERVAKEVGKITMEQVHAFWDRSDEALGRSGLLLGLHAGF
jgi:insulysin